MHGSRSCDSLQGLDSNNTSNVQVDLPYAYLVHQPALSACQHQMMV